MKKIKLSIPYLAIKVYKDRTTQPEGVNLEAKEYNLVGIEFIKATTGDTGNKILHDHFAFVVELGDEALAGIPCQLKELGYAEVI